MTAPDAAQDSGRPVYTAPRERRSFENCAKMAPSMPDNCASEDHAASHH